MTHDQMLGMSIDDLLSHINGQRRRAGLTPIAVSSRPSNSCPGKTTLEVFAGEVLFCKSTSGGAINIFLKGMMAMNTNAAPPKINMNSFKAMGGRSIKWG